MEEANALEGLATTSFHFCLSRDGASPLLSFHKHAERLLFFLASALGHGEEAGEVFDERHIIGVTMETPSQRLSTAPASTPTPRCVETYSPWTARAATVGTRSHSSRLSSQSSTDEELGYITEQAMTQWRTFQQVCTARGGRGRGEAPPHGIAALLKALVSDEASEWRASSRSLRHAGGAASERGEQGRRGRRGRVHAAATCHPAPSPDSRPPPN
mmetsp:Transcript_19007/g.60288  ORF Transcript_19007/g.60288 Transcript_19007/m.60288 type:complete len:215 (+) Transcript_19007:600-1244(+)